MTNVRVTGSAVYQLYVPAVSLVPNLAYSFLLHIIV
jgi:hypothetical protein